MPRLSANTWHLLQKASWGLAMQHRRTKYGTAASICARAQHSATFYGGRLGFRSKFHCNTISRLLENNWMKPTNKNCNVFLPRLKHAGHFYPGTLSDFANRAAIAWFRSPLNFRSSSTQSPLGKPRDSRYRTSSMVKRSVGWRTLLDGPASSLDLLRA